MATFEQKAVSVLNVQFDGWFHSQQKPVPQKKKGTNLSEMQYTADMTNKWSTYIWKVDFVFESELWVLYWPTSFTKHFLESFFEANPNYTL